jgi:glycosyltransferase involved in cell wall biosynthesis
MLSDRGFDVRHGAAARERSPVASHSDADTVEVVSCPWADFDLDGRVGFTAWRTMYETSGIPESWRARANEVDEVWVPSDFNVETFARCGVDPAKLAVLPAPIDTSRFRPPAERVSNEVFTFLSIFRWQMRKGWDLLLDAYLRAFSPSEPVRLVIQSLPLARSAAPPREQVWEHLELDVNDSWPTIEIRDSPVGDEDVVRLYQASDAFVLASRGEGCGRPYMEAMSTGLPTIGTRWSGNLAFMDDANSLLVDASIKPVSAMAATEWPLFAGQSWAEPDVEMLSQQMRRAFEMSSADRAALGERARRTIEDRQSFEVVERELINRMPAAVRVGA